jgi:acetyltransferase
MDPHNIHPLATLFEPRSIAVVGASEREGSLGRFVFENMTRAGFRGVLYPVNPKYRSVLGVRAYANMDQLPETPDLVVVASPAHTVVDIVHDAGTRGTRAALVLSAGFAEIGEEGRIRAELVRRELSRYHMRMVGPNCVGFLRPSIGLNATFAASTSTPIRAGALALVAQSGAVCTAILDWAATTEIGFSSVVSLGGALDVDFGDVLDFLVHDAETRSILLYIEGVRDAKRFMSSLRAAARLKPVVVLKAGRSQAGTQAVTSHTGALAGSDLVWESALARAGSVRVNSSLQLFAAARLLADPRIVRSLQGERLAIVTNGGGPGVVAADCLERHRLPLAQLSAETIAQLNRVLPPHWSHGNPVDIIGDATPERFRDALDAVLKDENVDAVLTLYCPQSVTTAEAAAEAVIPSAAASLAEQKKPVFTSWLGGASIIKARATFERAGVPNFLTPENAIDAFSYLTKFRAHQTMLVQSVSAMESMSFHDLSQAIARASRIREQLKAENRTLLREMEAKALLDAFNLPVSVGHLATSAEDAAASAASMGFPVVLKIDSPTITHKSDIGGVRLNLMNTRQVASAFTEMMRDITERAPDAVINGVNVQPMLKFTHSREVLIGIARDPTFGPVISFGTGGVAVEAAADVALALPPLNIELAHALMAQTHVSRVLKAYRNVPAVDAAALAQMLVRVSTLACALPWVREMDLNPVLAHPSGAAIVDARIVIDHTSPVTDTRYAHLSIFPYPVSLERKLRLKDKTQVHMRAIRPDDAARERAFVAAMSDTSRYYRFLHPLAALSDEMIARFTQLDYRVEMALVALTEDESEIIGVARYHPNADGESAEFAIAIADAWQGKGLGDQLMRNLIACAEEAGYMRLSGTVLKTNTGMLHLAQRLGFESHPESVSHETLAVTLALKPAADSAPA